MVIFSIYSVLGDCSICDENLMQIDKSQLSVQKLLLSIALFRQSTFWCCLPLRGFCVFVMAHPRVRLLFCVINFVRAHPCVRPYVLNGADTRVCPYMIFILRFALTYFLCFCNGAPMCAPFIFNGQTHRFALTWFLYYGLPVRDFYIVVCLRVIFILWSVLMYFYIMICSYM